MKKIKAKDKLLRNALAKKKISFFVLKSIVQNFSFSSFTRWKVFNEKIKLNKSKSMLTNRCVETLNRKRHNKITLYSRHLFLKLIRSGKISGCQKAVW